MSQEHRLVLLETCSKVEEKLVQDILHTVFLMSHIQIAPIQCYKELNYATFRTTLQTIHSQGWKEII